MAAADPPSTYKKIISSSADLEGSCCKTKTPLDNRNVKMLSPLSIQNPLDKLTSNQIIAAAGQVINKNSHDRQSRIALIK